MSEIEAVLRSELPPLPARIAKLPRHRGYPVPWFVQWFTEERQPTNPGTGEPDFRVIDVRRYRQALGGHLCWVCGRSMHARGVVAFVVGPMCAINRISAEPPAHGECATFSALACPFLSRPHMRRRTAGQPDNLVLPAGQMIERNPGVALVWFTRSYRVAHVEEGFKVLLEMGHPTQIKAYREGRPASRDELAESVRTGLPILEAMARAEGAEAMEELERMKRTAFKTLGLPRHTPTPQEE